MPVYVVSVETVPGRSHVDLGAALSGYRATEILPSQYAIRVEGTASDLVRALSAHLAPSESLLVMARDSGDWASTPLKTNLAKI